MICLLLIMTMIFINSAQSTEQKVRHKLLKEEEMNAKTKAWLLMVESGKVDQEELRRITPKSIFIAPLLTGRLGKCKEGYRHDHLGQCVKVIKIDPQVQLELLLQKLNKLYGGNEKDGKEEPAEPLKVSSGPLHFSLPISNSDEKVDQTTAIVKSETSQVPSTIVNTTTEEIQSVPEFIPIPLPMIHLNKTNPTNQTKDFESSGAEPLNETESYEPSVTEGSGEGQSASGDGFQEEESTTPSQVSILSEDIDYFEVTETDSTTSTEIYSTPEPPVKELDSTKPPSREVLMKESYQNITDSPSVYNSTVVLPDENVNKEVVKNSSNSDRIYFPSDEEGDDAFRTLKKPPIQSSAIRFPDEIPQHQTPSYLSQLDLSNKSSKYQSHSSAIPREQFWWLPKNWEIDENQKKSALVKVWSRLPLIHDITYSHETFEGLNNPPLKETHRQILFPSPRNEGFSKNPSQQQPTGRVVKPFKSSRFQDILLTPRQNFRFQ